MSNNENDKPEGTEAEFDGNGNSGQHITPLSGMYENWFLDYASYVILERAVPHINY